ncbi:MAG: hypothetical protein GX458_08955, partial [Phyllobacteriaceae bacterium]|nr:hypothetical protein [Phyllobacteriaceae bacterium]
RDAARRRTLVVGVGENFSGGDFFEIPDGGPARKIEKGPHGILDGLALLPDGETLISDWVAFDPPTAGVLTRQAADGAVIGRLDLGRAVHGPADFAVDPAKGEIWIPAMLEGVVVIAPPTR